jgi:hypothetical protein
MSSRHAFDAWHVWEAAIRTFVQDKDGKPLAALLRSVPPRGDGSVPIPPGVIRTLAELFDPQTAWNPFAKPCRLPPDQIEIVNGKRRLKGTAEREAAAESAEVARKRLIQGAKRGKELDTLEALEKRARDTGDEEAFRAFADFRKADAKVQAARKLTYNAVQLATKPLTRPRTAARKASTRLTQVELLERNLWIMYEMRLAIQEGQTVSDAAYNIGEKLDPRLSERQVTEIWSAARKAHPTFFADLPRGKKRR